MNTPAEVIAKRVAHPLNDKTVTPKEGVTVTNASGVGVRHGVKGIVWAVTQGKAMVHFGTSESGHPLGRMVANVDDLIEA